MSTLVLSDSRQVITGSGRAPEDYGRMGLAVHPASLHCRRRDGPVHAIDLRTVGHTRVALALTRACFVGMGFDVRRHTGTADHPPVSMPSRALWPGLASVPRAAVYFPPPLPRYPHV